MDSSDSSEPDSSAEESSRRGSRHRGVRNARHRRAILRWAQDGRCWYCGIEMTVVRHWTIKHRLTDETCDHLLPWCKGGDDSDENIVLACRQCNSQKKDRTLEEYRLSRRKSLRKSGGRFFGETMTGSSEVERSPDKAEVAGSTPALSTI
jgi:5-methylcytosine-specific restriction endonuclease McrA